MANITLRGSSASASGWSNTSYVYDASTSTAGTVSVKKSNYSSRGLTVNFDISSITEKIVSATLTVNASASASSRINMYVDVNSSSNIRVINKSLGTSQSNYTADITEYIGNLQHLLLTPYTSSNQNTTFSVYDVKIDIVTGGSTNTSNGISITWLSDKARLDSSSGEFIEDNIEDSNTDNISYPLLLNAGTYTFTAGNNSSSSTYAMVYLYNYSTGDFINSLGDANYQMSFTLTEKTKVVLSCYEASLTECTLTTDDGSVVEESKTEIPLVWNSEICNGKCDTKYISLEKGFYKVLSTESENTSLNVDVLDYDYLILEKNITFDSKSSLNKIAFYLNKDKKVSVRIGSSFDKDLVILESVDGDVILNDYIDMNSSVFNEPLEILTPDDTITNYVTASVDNTGLTNVTSPLFTQMYTAAMRGMKFLMPRGTYLVDELEIPEGLTMHCSEGVIFKRDVAAKEGTGAIGIYKNNITITGRLTVDGQSEIQTIGGELIPNVFLYNANNVYIESIWSYNSYADGVQVAGDGGATLDGYCCNGYIGYIKSWRCGRKNLVLEHMDDFTVRAAILDNTEGNRQFTGGHCLDVEPFNYDCDTGLPISLTIGYIKTIGTGNDLEAGLGKANRIFRVNIGVFDCTIKSLPTAEIGIGDKHEYLGAMVCHALKVNVNKMKVNLDSIPHPTDTSYNKTHYPHVLYCCYGGEFNICSLIVKGGASGGSLFICHEETYAGITGAPKVDIEYLSGDVNNYNLATLDAVESFNVSNLNLGNLSDTQVISITGTTGPYTIAKNSYVKKGINNLLLGNLKVNDIFLGDTKIMKAYLGSLLVYEKIKELLTINVWNVLGDSLTEGYLMEDNLENLYHQVIKTNYNVHKVNNYGIGGTCFAVFDSELNRGKSFIERYSDMDDNADFITVWGGTNDFLDSVPLGTINDTSNTTVYGAIKLLCEGLKAKYPNSTIAFITPINFSSDYHNNYNLNDYCDAIRKVCAIHKIPVIDLYKKLSIDDVLNSLQDDGVHLNAYGHSLVAQAIVDGFNIVANPDEPGTDVVYPNIDGITGYYTAKDFANGKIVDRINNIEMTMTYGEAIEDYIKINDTFTASTDIGTGPFSVFLEGKVLEESSTTSIPLLLLTDSTFIWDESISVYIGEETKNILTYNGNDDSWVTLRTDVKHAIGDTFKMIIIRESSNRQHLYINSTSDFAWYDYTKVCNITNLSKEYETIPYGFKSLATWNRALTENEVGQLFDFDPDKPAVDSPYPQIDGISLYLTSEDFDTTHNNITDRVQNVVMEFTGKQSKGADGYIIPVNDTFFADTTIGTNPFTLYAELKITTACPSGGNIPIFMLTNYDMAIPWDESISMYYVDTKEIEMYNGNDNSWHTLQGGLFEVGSICKIAITRDSNNKITMYYGDINTSLSYTYTKKINITNISKEYDANGYGLGKIAVFDRVISSSELESLFNS